MGVVVSWSMPLVYIRGYIVILVYNFAFFVTVARVCLRCHSQYHGWKRSDRYYLMQA